MVPSIAPLAGLTIATSVLTLIGLLTFLVISRHGHRVEITSLVLLWVFWLSVGADATSVKSQLVFIGNEPFLRRSTISDSGNISADRGKLGAIAAFGFMIWISLTGYLCILIIYLYEEDKVPMDTAASASPQVNIPQSYQQSPEWSYAGSQSPKLTLKGSSILTSSSLGGRNRYGGDPKFACLMCRGKPKDRRFDFCGTKCRDEARNLAPVLLEVPQGHTTFATVESKFRQAWKMSNRTVCPLVQHVYRVVESWDSFKPYQEYLRIYGNEVFRYHGTNRSCQLGDDGHTTLCKSSFCKACSIIRTSFEVSLSNPGGAFGQGIYTSSASNKSANYSESPSSGLMFLTKVVLGNVCRVDGFAEVKECPTGFQSVEYDKMSGKLNETVVYTNDAIRPVFLIVFG